jgi:hypothetical protein
MTHACVWRSSSVAVERPIHPTAKAPASGCVFTGRAAKS